MVIVLVVMWLVVLVPMFVRRHEDPGEVRSRERIATAVRVLSRRSHRAAGSQPASASRPAVDPALQPLARQRSAGAAHVRAKAQRRMLARRRRTVAMLATLAFAGAGGAIGVTGWLWPLAGLGAALFTSYLVWLRQQVRRQQERWQRRAAVFSRTTPSYPSHTVVRPARPRRAARRDRVSHESAPHPEMADRGDPAARPAADGSWQPTPVPVPTYVTKAAYRPADSQGRAESVVALDDDDPSFTEIEDVVPPVERRHAVNG
jgi:hypothetical protein